MGNRAVITTKQAWANDGIGIYLHWNGGRDSVEAFLDYCRLRGFRTGQYGIARLAQVIGNYFGGGLSIGIDTLWHLDCDNGDNGVYIVEDWKIVDRRYYHGEEQREYALQDMLKEIDAAQPAGEQIGEDFFDAEPVRTADLQIGNMVWVQDWQGKWMVRQVAGIGDGRTVNGFETMGVPYIAEYGDEPAGNINNYLREAEYLVDRF